MKEAGCVIDEYGEDARNKNDSLLYQQQQLELWICTCICTNINKKNANTHTAFEWLYKQM